MRRRAFIAVLGSAAAWPLAAQAQQLLPIVGFVNSTSPGGYPPLSAFQKGLAEAGFVEGRNLTIEYRWAEGHYERLPALIADLIHRKVSVIAATSTPAAIAAKSVTTTVPVVFTTSGDPVQLGLVSSLATPGGNLTGTTQLNTEMATKRLELLHEALPNVTKIALLINPPSPLTTFTSRDISAAAASLGLNLQTVRASGEQDLPGVFESLNQVGADALVITSDAFFSGRGEELGRLSVRHRVPAIYQYPQFTAAGGLISYGGNVAESYRLAGNYVGRILKGEKPADLSVQQVTKIELIINLKTARTLGLKIPLPLLGRADEVIE
jgi:putative ABC transport system substrate-binding protein